MMLRVVNRRMAPFFAMAWLLFAVPEAHGQPAATAQKAGLANAGTLVTHYYTTILRRPPDPGGKAFWEGEAARVAGLGANVNEAWFAMAMAFFSSSEYASFNRDTAGFVTDLYKAFFDRSPDAGGLAFWTNQIAGGMPREVALASFLFSAEFNTFTQGLFGSSPAAAEVDAVVDFYRGLLARLPDSGGLLHWVGRFRDAQCLNAASIYAQVEAISAAFAQSGEYIAHGRTNAQYVGDLYNSFLRRGGDLGGVLHWINQLGSGARSRENVRQQFLASPEFNGRVARMVAEGCRPSPVEAASASISSGQALTLSLPTGVTVAVPANTYAPDTVLGLFRSSTTESLQGNYSDTTAILNAGPMAPTLFVLDSGASPPLADSSIAITVSPEFLAGLPAGHKPNLFARAETQDLDAFAALHSTYDPAVRMLSATIPAWACTDQRHGTARWECLLAVGSLPEPSTTTPSSKAGEFEAAGCTVPFYSPLKGKTPLETTGFVSSPFGLRNGKFHQGTDYGGGGALVVPAASGYVEQVRCSRTFGEFIIVRHPDNSTTLYAHLEMGSIQLKNSLGQPVSHEACTEAIPAKSKPPKTFKPGEVPVISGHTILGMSDTTGCPREKGGVCLKMNPHLHFEYSAGKILLQRGNNMGGRLDGAACIAQDPPPPSCNAFYCFNKCSTAYNACYDACPSSPPFELLACMRACDGVFNRCPATTDPATCTCSL